MEILLLGPVRLRAQSRPVELGSDKERIALAALAVEPGRAVSVDTLITRLWESTPPRHAREGVHAYVSRLRKRLSAEGPGGPTIAARAHTYLLRCDEDCVDWRRFQRLVSTRPIDDDALAVEVLSKAAGLWAGEPLSGMSGVWADSTRHAMAEQRLRADVLRITALLRMGEFTGVIGELAALADQRPTDETVQGLLMVAYHGCRRSAEALHVHQRLRQTLDAEYGARPGREIDRLLRGVLDRVPACDLIRNAATRAHAAGDPPAETAAPAAEPEPRVTPRNLPHQPPLIGRGSELRFLTEHVAGRSEASVISLETVTGMAGVGKTALAVHTADRLTGRYPSAQLYLNFRGHADQTPVTPAEAVTTLLRLLGTGAQQIPADPDEQNALWHHMLAERRVVMVLDDIADSGQILGLLPRTDSCLAIVTSRRHIAGIPHARRIRLDVLPTPDAITLFRRFAGELRTGDMRLVRRIVELCGHLPLAIELVAGRFHTRMSWTLDDLVRHLSTPGRLAEIHDPQNSLARAFELSYRTLDQPQRRAFRLLSLHPGADVTADAAAALLDLPLGRAESLIEGLLACHLLSEPVPERFQYHDLLREYARSLMPSGDQEATAAFHRLITFYAAITDAADRRAYPRRLRPRDAAEQPGGGPGPRARGEPEPLPAADGTPAGERFPDAASAKAWLAAERQNLLASFEHVVGHAGTPARDERSAGPDDRGRAADLGYSLAHYLEAECHWQDAETVLGGTARIWRTTRDRRSQSLALLNLAGIQTDTAQYTASARNIATVLAYARATHDEPVESEALRIQGLRQWHEAEYEGAAASYERALALKKATGDVLGQAQITNNIAVVNLFRGRHDEAMEQFHVARRAFAEENDELSSARILNNIGDRHLRRGELESARQAFDDALAILERVGNRYDRATTRAGLADTFAEMGRLREALAMYEQCLAEFRSLGDHKSAAETLIALAHAYGRLGDRPAAKRYRNQALTLATRIGAAHLMTAAGELPADGTSPSP